MEEKTLQTKQKIVLTPAYYNSTEANVLIVMGLLLSICVLLLLLFVIEKFFR